MSIMYGYGDIDPEINSGHIFGLLGSRYVIGHVTIRLSAQQHSVT